MKSGLSFSVLYPWQVYAKFHDDWSSNEDLKANRQAYIRMRGLNPALLPSELPGLYDIMHVYIIYYTQIFAIKIMTK